MQDGEEVLTLDVSQAKGQRPEGSLTIKHAKESIYGENGYTLRTGTGNLISLHKRKRTNMSDVSSSDNSASLMTYTIDAPVGLLTPGQCLWVRLSDTTSGALSSGPVTNSTDDLDNTDVNSNTWEIRDAEDAPVRTFDNRGVFLLAKCITVGSEDVLLFSDGTIVGRLS